MRKILLPTDFSENAFNAIKYAIQLLEDKECIFYLLNTYTPILYDSDFIFYNSSTLGVEEIYHQNSLMGLEKTRERIGKELNISRPIEIIAAFNLLNEAIREQVKEKQIELVVMGTQGATGAEQILFGTHTVHAIKRIECPLLAIPSGFSFETPKDILFPTDYDVNYSRQHLKILKDIATANNSLIHVLHVNFGSPLSPEQQKHKDLLSDYLSEVPHQFHDLEDKTVPQGIYQFQDEMQIDMMVMISNKHSFFENLLFRPVISEIGFNLKIPLLVIPSGKFNR